MKTKNTFQIIPITPKNQQIGFSMDLTEKVREYGRLGLEGAVNCILLRMSTSKCRE